MSNYCVDMQTAGVVPLLGAAVLDDKENESSNHFNGLLHQPGQEQNVFVLNIFVNNIFYHIMTLTFLIP